MLYTYEFFICSTKTLRLRWHWASLSVASAIVACFVQYLDVIQVIAKSLRLLVLVIFCLGILGSLPQ